MYKLYHDLVKPSRTKSMANFSTIYRKVSKSYSQILQANQFSLNRTFQDLKNEKNEEPKPIPVAPKPKSTNLMKNYNSQNYMNLRNYRKSIRNQVLTKAISNHVDKTSFVSNKAAQMYTRGLKQCLDIKPNLFYPRPFHSSNNNKSEEEVIQERYLQSKLKLLKAQSEGSITPGNYPTIFETETPKQRRQSKSKSYPTFKIRKFPRKMKPYKIDNRTASYGVHNDNAVMDLSHSLTEKPFPIDYRYRMSGKLTDLMLNRSLTQQMWNNFLERQKNKKEEVQKTRSTPAIKSHETLEKEGNEKEAAKFVLKKSLENNLSAVLKAANENLPNRSFTKKIDIVKNMLRNQYIINKNRALQKNDAYALEMDKKKKKQLEGLIKFALRCSNAKKPDKIFIKNYMEQNSRFKKPLSYSDIYYQKNTGEKTQKRNYKAETDELQEAKASTYDDSSKYDLTEEETKEAEILLQNKQPDLKIYYDDLLSFKLAKQAVYNPENASSSFNPKEENFNDYFALQRQQILTPEVIADGTENGTFVFNKNYSVLIDDYKPSTSRNYKKSSTYKQFYQNFDKIVEEPIGFENKTFLRSQPAGETNQVKAEGGTKTTCNISERPMKNNEKLANFQKHKKYKNLKQQMLVKKKKEDLKKLPVFKKEVEKVESREPAQEPKKIAIKHQWNEKYLNKPITGGITKETINVKISDEEATVTFELEKKIQLTPWKSVEEENVPLNDNVMEEPKLKKSPKESTSKEPVRSKTEPDIDIVFSSNKNLKIQKDTEENKNENSNKHVIIIKAYGNRKPVKKEPTEPTSTNKTKPSTPKEKQSDQKDKENKNQKIDKSGETEIGTEKKEEIFPLYQPGIFTKVHEKRQIESAKKDFEQPNNLELKKLAKEESLKDSSTIDKDVDTSEEIARQDEKKLGQKRRNGVGSTKEDRLLKSRNPANIDRSDQLHTTKNTKIAVAKDKKEQNLKKTANPPTLVKLRPNNNKNPDTSLGNAAIVKGSLIEEKEDKKSSEKIKDHKVETEKQQMQDSDLKPKEIAPKKVGWTKLIGSERNPIKLTKPTAIEALNILSQNLFNSPLESYKLEVWDPYKARYILKNTKSSPTLEKPHKYLLENYPKKNRNKVEKKIDSKLAENLEKPEPIFPDIAQVGKEEIEQIKNDLKIIVTKYLDNNGLTIVPESLNKDKESPSRCKIVKKCGVNESKSLQCNLVEKLPKSEPVFPKEPIKLNDKKSNENVGVLQKEPIKVDDERSYKNVEVFQVIAKKSSKNAQVCQKKEPVNKFPKILTTKSKQKSQNVATVPMAKSDITGLKITELQEKHLNTGAKSEKTLMAISEKQVETQKVNFTKSLSKIPRSVILERNLVCFQDQVALSQDQLQNLVNEDALKRQARRIIASSEKYLSRNDQKDFGIRKEAPKPLPPKKDKKKNISEKSIRLPTNQRPEIRPPPSQGPRPDQTVSSNIEINISIKENGNSLYAAKTEPDLTSSKINIKYEKFPPEVNEKTDTNIRKVNIYKSMGKKPKKVDLSKKCLSKKELEENKRELESKKSAPSADSVKKTVSERFKELIINITTTDSKFNNQKSEGRKKLVEPKFGENEEKKIKELFKFKPQKKLKTLEQQNLEMFNKNLLSKKKETKPDASAKPQLEKLEETQPSGVFIGFEQKDCVGECFPKAKLPKIAPPKQQFGNEKQRYQLKELPKTFETKSELLAQCVNGEKNGITLMTLEEKNNHQKASSMQNLVQDYSKNTQPSEQNANLIKGCRSLNALIPNMEEVAKIMGSEPKRVGIKEPEEKSKLKLQCGKNGCQISSNALGRGTVGDSVGKNGKNLSNTARSLAKKRDTNSHKGEEIVSSDKKNKPETPEAEIDGNSKEEKEMMVLKQSDTLPNFLLSRNKSNLEQQIDRIRSKYYLFNYQNENEPQELPLGGTAEKVFTVIYEKNPKLGNKMSVKPTGFTDSVEIKLKDFNIENCIPRPQLLPKHCFSMSKRKITIAKTGNDSTKYSNKSWVAKKGQNLVQQPIKFGKICLPGQSIYKCAFKSIQVDYKNLLEYKQLYQFEDLPTNFKPKVEKNDIFTHLMLRRKKMQENRLEKFLPNQQQAKETVAQFKGKKKQYLLEARSEESLENASSRFRLDYMPLNLNKQKKSLDGEKGEMKAMFVVVETRDEDMDRHKKLKGRKNKEDDSPDKKT